MEVNEAKIIKSIILLNGPLICYCGNTLKITNIIDKKENHILLQVEENGRNYLYGLKCFAAYDFNSKKVLDPGTFSIHSLNEYFYHRSSENDYRL